MSMSMGCEEIIVGYTLNVDKQLSSVMLGTGCMHVTACISGAPGFVVNGRPCSLAAEASAVGADSRADACFPNCHMRGIHDAPLMTCFRMCVSGKLPMNITFHL
jgi:hypothetical protein